MFALGFRSRSGKVPEVTSSRSHFAVTRMMDLTHFRIDLTPQTHVNLWIDVVDRRLNVLFEEVFLELRAVLRMLVREGPARPLVLRSGKERGFVVGADLRRIHAIQTAEQIQAFLQIGQEVLTELSEFPQTTLAWIQGACLGGGLELALACDYRIASDDVATQLGMPESKLGLTPGWGGTQRIIPLVGLENGLRLLLYGESVTAAQACAMGLVDGTWSREGAEECEQISLWLQRLVAHRSKRSHNSSSKFSLVPEEWAATLEMREVACGVGDDAADPVIGRARETILRDVEAGANGDCEAGFRAERENFFDLLIQPRVQEMLASFATKRSSTSGAR